MPTAYCKTVGYTHYRVTEITQHQDEQVFVVEVETFLDPEMGEPPIRES